MEVETTGEDWHHDDSDDDDDREELEFLFGRWLRARAESDDDDSMSESDEDLDDEMLAEQLLGLMDIFDESELIDDCGLPRRRSPRRPDEPRDPSSSPFGKVLSQADINEQTKGSVWDESHNHGVKFRRRYRLPYVLFDHIFEEYDKVDNRNEVDAFGHPKIDARYLIMGVLRYLGQLVPFDSLEELSDVSPQMHHQFFHKFIKWFSDPAESKFAKNHLKMPETDEEILHVTRHYHDNGVPGTGGSIDCVHIAWDNCPAGARADCKGKEKFPTVAFQVIGSHTPPIPGGSLAFRAHTLGLGMTKQLPDLMKI